MTDKYTIDDIPSFARGIVERLFDRAEEGLHQKSDRIQFLNEDKEGMGGFAKEPLIDFFKTAIEAELERIDD